MPIVSLTLSFYLVVTLRVERLFEKGLKKTGNGRFCGFVDMNKRCAIFSKLLAYRFAEMYNEYKNIV